MEEKAGGPLDLEKELSCSICTDVLYQPLTLLDCLHTFCGSCLKEWFVWQAGSATKEHPYTCPACRAAVRGTRPNATVTTLLDIFIRAHPEKDKSQEDKFHIGRTYYAGENVIPHVEMSQYAEDSEDERLLAHARGLSLGSNSRPGHGRAHHGTGDRHSRRHAVNIATTAPRRLDHQSSLRSLLSASEPDNTKLQEEIMQQIVDEGLLDNVDLNNLTSAQEEEITESIARAFRRRQAANPSHGHRTREIARPPLEQPSPLSRPRTDPSVQKANQRRLSSQSGQAPNISAAATPYSDNANALSKPARPAIRSTTDLAPTSHVAALARDAPSPLSSRGTARSSPRTSSLTVHSTPNLDADTSGSPTPAQHLHGRGNLHTSSRARYDSTGVFDSSSPTPPTATARRGSALGDTRPLISSSATYIPYSVAATTPPTPLTICSRCETPIIEQQFHYNCGKCASGTFNLCLSCYRAGKGCLHWFGFGHAAYDKFGTLIHQGIIAEHDAPHLLSARRYLLSSSETPQEGLFCEGCFAFADDCYWHCQECNDGAWGFCNNCVQTAKHCTHPLQCIGKTPRRLGQPLDSSEDASIYPPPLHTSKWSHRSADHQSLARKLSNPILPHVIEPSQYAAMNMNVYCDICEQSIAPSHTRFHCPVCNNGNYDICTTCYRAAAVSGRMKQEDGPQGWRRCFQGHRMNMVGFEDREGGSARVVVEDIVGGWSLKNDKISSHEARAGTLSAGEWSWNEEDGTRALQTPRIQRKTMGPGITGATIGRKAQARWSRFPDIGFNDELAFPRNAVITEVEDINGDWCWGVYAGRGGLFPGNFVRLV